MEVLVDTSVWSEYFRREQSAKSDNVELLKTLINGGRAVIAGVVKQELLSGIKEKSRFDKLKALLSPYPVLLANDNDHISAARFFNECKNNGIQGSFTDFLICAQSCNNRLSILSSDLDFEHFEKILPIKLWKA